MAQQVREHPTDNAITVPGTGISNEYNWYMNSRERETNQDRDWDPDNPTNTIIVRHKMPRERLPVVMLSLHSIELPLAEYTVEAGRTDCLVNDEGLRLLDSDASSVSTLHTLTVTVDGDVLIATLPLALNPITSVDDTVPTSPVITTMYPHALELRSAYSLGNWRVINTDETNDAFANLDNATVTILSDTTFRMSAASGMTSWSAASGPLGYVSTPPIAHPDELAALLAVQFASVRPGTVQVSWNGEANRFRLEILDSTITQAFLFSPADSLASRMGFTQGNLMFSVPRDPFKPVYGGQRIQASMGGNGHLTMQSHLDPQCLGLAKIREGTYQGAQFGSVVQSALTPAYVDPGATVPLSFGLREPSGNAVTFSITPGLYNDPDNLAAELQTLLTANSTDAGQTYTVTANKDATSCGRVTATYTISGTFPFGLNFGSGTDTAYDLFGFDPIDLEGSTDYTSSRSMVYPKSQCCSGSVERYPSLTKAVLLNTSTNRYSIHARPPPCVDVTIVPGVGMGTYEVAITNNILPGWQVDDVIRVRTSAGSDTTTFYYFAIENVVDSRNFVINAGATGANFAIQVGLSLNTQACLDREPTLNLYLSDAISGGLSAPRLGFPRSSAFARNSLPLHAPYCFNLSGPPYVLLRVSRPHGDTHNVHRRGENVDPRILAKIILYPEFRLERLMPFNMYLQGIVQVTDMKFELVTPDQQPYQLHGKDWSATISFRVAQNQDSKLLAMG